MSVGGWVRNPAELVNGRLDLADGRRVDIGYARTMIDRARVERDRPATPLQVHSLADLAGTLLDAVLAIPTVAGRCPMGCPGGGLRLNGDQLVCVADGCPQPDAAERILADAESEHVVDWAADGFTIRHPLRERLDDALLVCALHAKIATWDAGQFPVGRYRVVWRDGGRSSCWLAYSREDAS